MNVTIKHRASDNAALLSKVSNIKFITKQSISKQIKDTIEFQNVQTVNRHNKRGGYLVNTNKNHYSNYNPQHYKVAEQQATTKISKIRFIDVHKNTHENRYLFSRQNNRENDNQIKHKMSIETAVSASNSADKRRPYSVQASETQIILRQQLCQLKEKNGAYMIRWKNSASNITKTMRVILGEWLMQFAKQIEMPKNAVYNAMHYLDKYAGAIHVSRKKYQQVGLCSFFIASKLEISSHPNIQTFLEALDGSCSRQQMVQLEQQMAFKLKFRLNPPTLYQYMVLVVSLLQNFSKRKNYDDLKSINLCAKSQFQKDLFWVLDGIHLEDSYKGFHNKEKVCLAILYLSLKKDKMKKQNISKKKILAQLESLTCYGNIERIFQEFLYEVIKIFTKISELKQCIKVFKKWIVYDRNLISDEQEGQMLKKIIINES